MAIEKRIFKVVVRRMLDDNPDMFYLGKYTNESDEWNIDRQSGEYIHDLTQPEARCKDCQEEEAQCCEHAWNMPERGREYRFFKPYAGGEKPGTEDYRRYGLQDFERSESYNRGSWCYIGIRAEAETGIAAPGNPGSWKLDKLTSSGLWGIESDSDGSYFESIEQEELADLRRILEAYGFSKRQINKAFEDIEEVNE